jgi:hypothetical protein
MSCMGRGVPIIVQLGLIGYLILMPELFYSITKVNTEFRFDNKI